MTRHDDRTRMIACRLRSWSLRNRLTVLYGGLFLLAGMVLLTILYFVVQHRLDDQLGSQADTRISELRRASDAGGASTVTLPDGTVVTVEAFAAQIHAEQEGLKNTTLHTLITQGGIAVAAVGLVAAGGGRLLAGRALHPLHAITATAERIASSRGPTRDLHERIGPTGRTDDTQRLADSFDAMLDSLEQTFDSQRRFVANASHELRTPLALERALIELEITKPGATPEALHFGNSLLRINERHARLMDGLLLLADSENAIEHPEPADLADIAAHVLATVDPADGGPDDVRVAADLQTAPVFGDPVLLEHLVRNLVENALRHNVGGGWVRAATGSRATHTVLTVSNTGPVIAPYETETLFQPFHRHDGDASGARRGFGLGLSIVRAITTTHGGTVTATARPEGGLDVTVRLARAAAGPSPS